MTEPNSDPMDDPKADPKVALRSGCMTVLAWAGLIAVIATTYYGADALAALLVGVRDSAEVVVFARPQGLGKELFYALVFAPALLLAAIAFAKRLMVALLLTAAVYGALAYWIWYASYTAITFHRDRLELHYLWPRPSEFIDPKAITSMNVVLSGQMRGEGGSDTLYALEIKTADASRESMAVGSQGSVFAVKERIMHMRTR